MEDYTILVSNSGEVVGTAPKLSSHNKHTLLHLAFSIFLFNAQGQLLLQQRSHKKKTWPGIWANSCCGHQKLDEKLEITGANRLRFELGITDAHLDVLLPDFRYKCEMNGIWENEICPVLVGITHQSPRPNPEEVEDTKCIFWEEWLHLVKNDDPQVAYWSKKETELLEKSSEFQIFLQREVRNERSR